MVEKFITFFLNKKIILIHFLLIVFYKLRILPIKYNQRAKSVIKMKDVENSFKSLKLIKSNFGYHSLVPMPSDLLLKSFYEESYWQNRDQNMYPVKKRDLDHYKLILDLYQDFNYNNKRILNFGSGHGGISILLHFKNHIIENFDYYKQKKIFDNKWKNLNDINEINGKYDLIYSSHSLEHVQDIKLMLNKFKDISSKDTIFFFEVPNCGEEKYIKISPPHTYYFTIDFFKLFFSQIDFAKSYNVGPNNLNELENIYQGNILRVAAKNIKNLDIL